MTANQIIQTGFKFLFTLIIIGGGVFVGFLGLILAVTGSDDPSTPKETYAGIILICGLAFFIFNCFLVDLIWHGTGKKPYIASVAALIIYFVPALIFVVGRS